MVAFELNIFQNIKRSIGNKNIETNIYRIEANNSIISGYFCIGFVDFILKVKSLLDYSNLFSTYEYEKNYQTILKHFQ